MLCKCFETCSFHAAEILPAPSAARSGGNEGRKDRFFPAAMSGTVILRIFVVKSAGLCLGPLRAFRPEKFENDEKTIGTSPDAVSGGGMDCVCDGPDDRFRTRKDGGSGQGAGCDAVGDLQCRGLQQIHPGRHAAVQELAGKFKTENGSVVCGELLSGAHLKASTEAVPEERTAEYYKKRPCPELVYSAAKILEEYLEAQKDIRPEK